MRAIEGTAGLTPRGRRLLESTPIPPQPKIRCPQCGGESGLWCRGWLGVLCDHCGAKILTQGDWERRVREMATQIQEGENVIGPAGFGQYGKRQVIGRYRGTTHDGFHLIQEHPESLPITVVSIRRCKYPNPWDAESQPLTLPLRAGQVSPQG